MNHCPVCGYLMAHPPTDFHICPSCGTEFGYDDSGASYEELRQHWLATGPNWWSPVNRRPEDWNWFNQITTGVILHGNPNIAGLSYEPSPLQAGGSSGRISGYLGRRRGPRKGFVAPQVVSAYGRMAA